MRITFLGTASCFPTPTRGVSCTALQFESGDIWLFDCGEGSQIQIQKSKLKASKITKIFITHLHGDHLFGLPGLLCTIGSQMDDNLSKNRILDIYGPIGLRKFITTSLSLARSPLPYKYNITELIPEKDQYPKDWDDWKVDHENIDILNLMENGAKRSLAEFDELLQAKVWRLENSDGNIIMAGPIAHRIPSFAYVFQESTIPGTLNVEKLQNLGIKPGPDYGKLKKGEEIKTKDGVTIKPEDVLGPPLKGRKVAIFGDTCDSNQMKPLCKNCDLVVHEATMENSLHENAVRYGHSTPEMAAEFAASVGAKMLTITHVSPRYKPMSALSGTDTPDEACTSNILLVEAQQALQILGSDCEVMVAEDFMELHVPRRK